jgi:DNA processing protein
VQRPESPDLFAAPPLPVAPLDDAQRLACLRLIRSENVGPATFRALINHYGGAGKALDALPELGRRTGRGRPIRICASAAAETELEAVRKARAHIVFTIEPGYPAALAFLEGAPPMLYAKGRLELLAGSVVAIVGSRQSSAAGLTMARQFAGTIGVAGHVIASGLARGIDGAAHRAAIETGTIAVLAGGLDVFYPPEHRELQGEIGERGCLVTEQPLGFQARAQDFPRRNRIISGLSRAVVVVEAAKRSGTLITARLANEQGREVFAVPGHPLDPRAEGTNKLIKDGATIATGPDDVLSVLGRQSIVRSVELDSSDLSGMTEPRAAGAGPVPTEVPDDALAEVERVLGPAPIAIDEVARATGLPARVVQVAVMELALAGAIEFHGGQLISLNRPG